MEENSAFQGRELEIAGNGLMPGSSAFRVFEVPNTAAQVKLYYQKIYEIDVKLDQMTFNRNQLIDMDYHQLKPSEILFLNEYDEKMYELQQDKRYWQELVANMQSVHSVVAGTSVSGFERDVMRIPLPDDPLTEKVSPDDSISQAQFAEDESTVKNSDTRRSSKTKRPAFLQNRKKWLIVMGVIVLIASVTTVCLLVFLPKSASSPINEGTNSPSPTSTNSPSSKVGPPKSYIVSTVAGTGAPGYRDGEAATAQFERPSAIAIDPSTGDLIVADSRNYMIRRISKGVVSTIAGNGIAGVRDGTGTQAQFNHPEGITFSPSGNIVIADTHNHLVRVISPSGIVGTVQSNLSYPVGITYDAQGNLFVADYDPSIIRRIGRDGVMSTFVGSGTLSSRDGTGTQASFNHLSDIAIDKNGTMYVAERDGGRLRTVSSSGVVNTLPGSYRAPWGVVIDSNSIVYVAEAEGHQISGLRPDGTKFVVAGTGTSGNADGTSMSSFDTPRGLAIDSNGVIYVADHLNHKIRAITPRWD